MVGRLALENNSEVDEVARGRCVVFPASVPALSSSQPKKQTHSLQCVLLGADLVMSPTSEVGDCWLDFRKEQL